MKCTTAPNRHPRSNWIATGLLLLAGVFVQSSAWAFNLSVTDRFGVAVTPPFRWLLEEDNTAVTVPGTPVNDSVSLVIHKSHAPTVDKGEVTAGAAPFAITADTTKRYIITVMKEGYSLGGAIVEANKPASQAVKVVLNAHEIPTAQISVLVFHDNNPINNAPDATEQGLGGFKVVIDDPLAGGPMLTDAFGNPLGTTYQFGGNGEPLMVDGAPVVDQRGDGLIYTDADGKALIKYLAPGKYGVRVIPPGGTSWTGAHGAVNVKGQWHQTATIEGTLTVDAWVKADEPSLFLEGFGPGFYHVFFGFVDPGLLPWDSTPPPAGGVTVRGTNIFNHFGRPPTNQMFAVGPPVPEAWIGLNEMVGGLPGRGLYAAPANADGSFEIPNVPIGTYQLVTWDKPLDALFGFNTIVVTNNASGVNDLNNVFSYRWFGTLEGSIFYDDDEDGFRDPAEAGIPLMAVNLRFRDGRIYQANVTDSAGDYGFAEVFPFFKWLVTEVDFARFKATGLTTVVDEGGVIPPDNGWVMPSEGVRNPQPQYNRTNDAFNVPVADASDPIINPNTGNNLSRTETGPVLTSAMHLFLNQNNRIDWGKINYPAGENGGISGIAFYSTTRAEEDPRNAVGDPWEPGIPRVQVALYQDANADKIIDNVNGVAGIQIADVDNHPLGWATGGTKGPEDIDHNNNNIFNAGDAISIVWTDSWDDTIDPVDGDPTLGAIQTEPARVLGKAIVGADNYATWNQVQPGVFDGGYAFSGYDPAGWNPLAADLPLPRGMYIVQAVPPADYLIQTEESMNVAFGDAYKPSKLMLPPECVGTRDNHGASAAGDAFVASIVPSTRTDPYTVADELSLFPNQNPPMDAPFAGTVRPLADMKWVRLEDGQNAAADFHMYTEVPKAARIVGFVLNDFTAEFNAFSPIFGEKGSPGWLPISVRDWAGTEIVRVYSDEYGSYNAMVPSTYTVNVPSPSGVSPNMLTLVLNDPTMPNPNAGLPGQPARIPDPFYNPNFSTTPWTFMYYPGSASYLDTPIVPIAALVGFPNNQLDSEPPTGTPVLKSVTNVTLSLPGPYVASIGAAGDILALTSMGTIQVPDPTSIGYQATATVPRDYGFGGAQGQVRLVGPDGVTRFLTIISWSDGTIRGRVPAGAPAGAHQLTVRRSTGTETPIGVTLTYGGGGTIRVAVETAPTEADPLPTPIQDAIEAANPGDLILVGPGNYRENPVMHKPVRLQGAGAGTVINAAPEPLDRVAAWHAFVQNNLGGDPFVANELPGIMVYSLSETAFQDIDARIDGFQIIGSIAGGGISLFNNAHDMRISNNRITGNQGTYGGGITLGMQGAVGLVYDNTNVTIERNQILKNGGVDGAGGIAIFSGATGYRILNNDIIGNFCRGNGGGISHEGLSPNGLIAGNRIAFNEVFFGVLVGGDGGGIYVTGEGVAAGLGSGAGSVTILNNLIQGNLAGSGHGGGIRAVSFNGADLVEADGETPTPTSARYQLAIINNIIVNNVAGWAGGGISLQDVVRSRIIHNTIARNDATATSRSAFQPNAVNSTAQVAGIAAHQHTVLVAGLATPAYSDPELLNNIIYTNRSWFFNGTSQRLEPGATFARDLGVPETPAALLNPRYCDLSAAYAGGNNNRVGDPRFVAGYTNDLKTAVVIDEAGNNISVRLMQKVVTDVGGGNPRADYGDYHLAAGTGSQAVNLALAPFPAPAVLYDYDKQTRPQGTPGGTQSNRPDIGADERGGSTPLNPVSFAPVAPNVGPQPDAAGNPPPTDAPAVGAGVPPGPQVRPAFVPPPTDTDGVDTDGDGNPNNDIKYLRLTGGDGFSRMADGNELYSFGFADALGVAPESVFAEGLLKAEFCAPTVALREGQKVYWDLSNVGMLMRPDLFDPHTVHFHGFPNAASIFDGEPMASLAINPGATLRYYYEMAKPGTFIYHCHVEATEHMEMGMLGTVYVTPKQNYAAAGTPMPKLPAGKGVVHVAGYKYAYNDGDGSTYYDVEFPLQFGAFDRFFHEQHIAVQPLPFSTLDESYPLINGRGYPDTKSLAPVTSTNVQEVLGLGAPYPVQKISSRITATAGQQILLRMNNVSLSDFHTITVLGIPMRVVAKDANLLRGPTGLDLSYQTTSFTFGGGESVDVILNTAGVTPGTYFLYDARLNHLCNDEEDFGGMMTEIIIQ